MCTSMPSLEPVFACPKRTGEMVLWEAPSTHCWFGLPFREYRLI